MRLDGEWSLRDETGVYALRMFLPGDIHSALIEQGLIEDTTMGDGVASAAWVAERDWFASRKFHVRRAECFFLLLDGLDCVAEIRVNDKLVMEAANAFRRHQADVTEAVKAGENEIKIRFRSPVREAEARHAARKRPLPAKAGAALPHGHLLRRPQGDFAKMAGGSLIPMGIWGRMELAGDTPLTLLGLKIVQEHRDGAVDLDIEVDLAQCAHIEGQCRFEIAGLVDEGPFTAEPGVFTLYSSFTIEEPQLWWPRGMGRQPIYELRILVGDIDHTVPVALRDIRLLGEGDETRLEVNGAPCFAKGANWVPVDALPGRITDERVRGLLSSAADAHMNLIRVLGSGRYESCAFYETCDALGLLVWQDFMFDGDVYPSSEDFLAEVSAEISYQARRLSGHVAFWCGGSGLRAALEAACGDGAERDQRLIAHDRLIRCIEAALRREDPTANWVAGCDLAGFVTGEALPSLPLAGLLRRYLREEDLNLSAPLLEGRLGPSGAMAEIVAPMLLSYRFPNGIGAFAYLSQIQQAERLAASLDHLRAARPEAAGLISGTLNDPWPGITAASLTYGGGWKAAHHAVSTAFAPVSVAGFLEEGGVRLVAMNDGQEAEEITLSVSRLGADGSGLPLLVRAHSLEPGVASELGVLAMEDMAGYPMVLLSWEGGSRLVPLRPWKEMDLLPPNISLRREIAGNKVELELRAADAPALFVLLEANVPGRFSANMLHLLRGKPVRVDFTPEAGRPAEVDFRIHDLHGATFAVPG